MNQNCKFLNLNPDKTCGAYMLQKPADLSEDEWCARCPFREEWNEPSAAAKGPIVKLIISCEGKKDILMGGAYDPDKLKWLILRETGGKVQLHYADLDTLFKPIGGQDKGDVFTEKR
jgi:hypothetical protein